MKIAVITGTAGSGKTALTYALSIYLEEKNEDYAIMNLDPGVKEDSLPYSPDINIRDYLRVEEVMIKYDLGPNGAFIATMDLVVNYLSELRQQIIDLSPDYLIIDTPGQMEVFAYRATGSVIIDHITNFPDAKKAVVFIFDPFLCRVSPGALISVLLLAESIYWRFELPIIYVLTKIDLLDEIEIKEILDLSEHPSKIIEKEKSFMTRHIEKAPLLSILINQEETLGKRLIPVSSVTGEGIFDLYSNLLNAWSETF